MLSGIGMLKYLHSNPNSIVDIIPVDIVSDEVIVTGAICANLKQLSVFNCGTSNRNPVVWETTRRLT